MSKTIRRTAAGLTEWAVRYILHGATSWDYVDAVDHAGARRALLARYPGAHVRSAVLAGVGAGDGTGGQS